MSTELKIGQTLENPVRMTPRLARQDYRNEILGFTLIIQKWMTDEEWRATLARCNVTEMKTFTAKFPSDEFPGIAEAQPSGTVKKFDQIAAEVTQGLQAGTITIARVRELADEMKKLCYQEGKPYWEHHCQSCQLEGSASFTEQGSKQNMDVYSCSHHVQPGNYGSEGITFSGERIVVRYSPTTNETIGEISFDRTNLDIDSLRKGAQNRQRMTGHTPAQIAIGKVFF